MIKITNMKKLLICSVFIVFSCQEKKENKTNENLVEVSKKDISESKVESTPKLNSHDAIDAQAWLKHTIESYFANEDSQDKVMKSITTKDYYEYKTDAMNVDIDVDGSLTEKQFYEKWKSKFDVKKVVFDSGFLISGQDWNKIFVSKNELINEENTSYLFDVIMVDEGNKVKYPRTIKVVRQGDKFLIADVWEN